MSVLRLHRVSVPAGLAPPRPRPEVDACLGAGTLLLTRAGIDSARLDAECLLAEALECPRWRLTVDRRRRLTDAQFARYLGLVERRQRREPVAYLLGRREFWSLPMAVSPDVLVPRPETETLVEAALGVADPSRPLLVVELCTGSGAVAVALATERPAARVLATDVSARALRVARANALAHGVADRITFARGDLWRAVNGWLPLAGADLVLANPPYVPSAALAGLMPEVGWEPRVALDGGPDGLRVLREIAATTRPRLAPGGHLAVEIGADQAGAVVGMLAAAGLRPAGVLRDLAGRDRVVVARRDG
jgi:release factor glutamine methyltransferase